MTLLEFDPRDPFPLVSGLAPEHYAAAKRHAASADAWLGLRVDKVEGALADPRDGQERWVGRHASVFLTPYVELRAWLEALRPQAGDVVVDLGAGYGRLGFVMARHFPQCRFRGYELVPERVAEGAKALQRFPAPSASLEVADISADAWQLPPAAIYFIYDFGSRESIAKVLEKLRERAGAQAIRVVGRGRGVRDQIERAHPWLGSVHEPIHGPHYSVYRSV